jgi:tryptophan-rich sensory protein
MTELRRGWPSLAVFLAITIVIQLIAGLWTASSVGDWYTTLKRAPWNPPGWVFGPVWTLL